MAGKDFAVEVVGARELRRRINSFDDEVSKAGKGELRSVYMSAARVVEVAAKGEAPARSGRLRATIRSQATVRGARVVAGNNAKGKTGVPYAAPIHWGWPSRPNRAKRWRGGPIRPNKFMMRARDDNADVVADALARGLQDLIDRRDL